ncbi:hypothetical protein BG003_000761 [Podila horticola]|nr:hypothetical protein BG003_000761 [Podila horticola]
MSQASTDQYSRDHSPEMSSLAQIETPEPAESPPGYSRDLASSQSLYEPLASSPAPAEEFLNNQTQYILDAAEIRGGLVTEEEIALHPLDKYSSLEERWAISSITLVDEGDTRFPKYIRDRLPVSCLAVIEDFLKARDEETLYAQPQGTTTQEIEVYSLLTTLSLSHGPRTLHTCCDSPSREMNFLVHHVTALFNTIFNPFHGFNTEWDRRLNINGLERPDIYITHRGTPVACGEIKPPRAAPATVEADRARVAEFMKRCLHERIVHAQSADEFRVVGFLISGSKLEISMMRFVDGEYLYKIYADIALATTVAHEDDLSQLLARMYFVRRWIGESVPATEGPRLHFDRTQLKPTLRLLT